MGSCLHKLRSLGLMAAVTAILSVCTGACSSSNCPLDNTVECNIGFYDMDGNATTLADELTVTTLLDGSTVVYIYRKLGEQTVTQSRRDSTLIAQGYTETVSTVRRDTVLLNKVTGASSISVPMSYYCECDTLIFKYASVSSADTVKIWHNNYPYVELPECGSYMFHNISGVSVTDISLDHSEVSKSKVDYEGLENVKLYLNEGATQ